MTAFEYSAPPDLMNRFTETPFTLAASHRGVPLTVHSNDASIFAFLPIVSDIANQTRFDWWILVEDVPATQRQSDKFRSGDIVTIKSANGTLTVLDRKLREAFTFLARAAISHSFGMELTNAVVDEVML